MLSLSDNNQADIIEAFNSTSRYLDSLNIDNPYFEQRWFCCCCWSDIDCYYHCVIL